MKLLKILSTFCLVFPMAVQAALVQQNISGSVTTIDANYTGTATLATTLDGFVIYDDEEVDALEHFFDLELDSAPGSDLSLSFNGEAYTLADDFWFNTGWPLATFEFGVFTGIDFGTEIATDVFFLVSGNSLSIEDDNQSIPLVLEGTVSFTAVPVPAAFWLFGSGLVVLATRLKRTRV